MHTEPTHQTAWAGALLFFLLFTVLFVIGETGGGSLVLYFRAVTFGLSIAFFCVGWQMREREKDEPVFDLILSERERRLRQ